MGFFTGAKCDKCGQGIAFVGVSAEKYITKWVRSQGWTVGKQVLCPKCKRGNKNAKV